MIALIAITAFITLTFSFIAQWSFSGISNAHGVMDITNAAPCNLDFHRATRGYNSLLAK